MAQKSCDESRAIGLVFVADCDRSLRVSELSEPGADQGADDDEEEVVAVFGEEEEEEEEACACAMTRRA